MLPIATSRSGDGKGSGFSNTALTTLKIAVLAPMPSASVRTATRENPGDLRSWRRANFRSFISFCPQRDDWINARCAASRNPGSEARRGEKKRAHAKINSQVETAYFKQYGLQCARDRD